MDRFRVELRVNGEVTGYIESNEEAVLLTAMEYYASRHCRLLYGMADTYEIRWFDLHPTTT